MGRTYTANNKSLEPFDVNSSGAEILGLLHKAIGKGLVKITTPEQAKFWSDRCPCTAYIMTEDEAIECAEALEKLDLVKFVQSVKDDGWHWEGLWGDTPEGLSEWVSAWASWLKQSKGYELY